MICCSIKYFPILNCAGNLELIHNKTTRYKIVNRLRDVRAKSQKLTPCPKNVRTA